MNYSERIKLLREKKIEHTKEKIRQNGYMDADDYGTVPLDKDFEFTPVANTENGRFYGLKGFSRNFADLLRAHPVYVDPLEIMCGRWATMLPYYRSGWPEDIYNFDHLKEGQELYGIVNGIGADAHFACDYSIGLSLGWTGILNKIRKYRLINVEAGNFYDAEELTVLSIQKFIFRHIDEIKKLLKQDWPAEIHNTLHKMLEANEWIVYNSPRTFLEACQWLAWFNIVSRIYDRDGAGCKLDKILLPYYLRDKREGVLDNEEAKFIIANLLLIETHYYEVSGADEAGRDLTNELTCLILEAAGMLNTSINITVRYHDKINKDFFEQAVNCLFEYKNGWPRFAGDKGLLGFTRNGYTTGDARDRIAVGCNWMALPGREYCFNDIVKINVAKVFELSLQNMFKQEEFSVEALWDIFAGNLIKAVDIAAQGINFHLEHQHKVMPELVMNLMMKNAIETGRDITQAAEMFNIGIDGVGLGTVADSFAAIEQRIVKERLISWNDLKSVLDSDFNGVEGERTRLMLSSSERYCQGGSIGDKWAEKISREFSKMIHEYKMPHGRKLIPGWFSWSSTIMFGKQVGATPNGRKAYIPVTHGANPTPGFRKDGAPTAMAAGIAKIQPGFGNPAPMQLELDPGLAAAEGGLERVMQIIRTYCDLGGTLLNINVLDKETLFAAHENPEQYPDLVVRVTGFTAYFAALSKEFRQLIIDRFLIM